MSRWHRKAVDEYDAAVQEGLQYGLSYQVSDVPPPLRNPRVTNDSDADEWRRILCNAYNRAVRHGLERQEALALRAMRRRVGEPG